MTTIPTLQELYTDVLNDLQAEYGVSVPLLTKVFLRAVAAVQAAKLKLAYLALGKVQKNIWPDTAEPEATGGTLERFGRIKIGRNPSPPTVGVYTIEVTGDIGSTIPAQTTFKSDSDSLNPDKLFIIDSAFTLVTSPDEIVVRALEAGVDSRLNVADTLTATIPMDNVDRVATVTIETVQPIAGEDTEEYRTTVLEAFQLEAQGGAGSDYRLWAADVQGVRTVYPYAAYAPNQVDIYVEANPADSSDGFGTPTAQMLTDVYDAINFDPDETQPQEERGRRPLTVFPNVYAISLKQVTITIDSYSGLDADKQALILSAIESLVSGIRPFVSSVDVLEDRNDTLSNNLIVSTILEAVPGSSFGSVTLRVDGVIYSAYIFENGNIPRLVSVSYT